MTVITALEFKTAYTKGSLTVEHILIGFDAVTDIRNYADCHKALHPFGFKWGRGILIKGSNYLEAVTGPYGITHSILKTSLEGDERTAGTFYYGYRRENRTLYLEYAADNNFSFHEKKILHAILESLKLENGPLKGMTIKNGVILWMNTEDR